MSRPSLSRIDLRPRELILVHRLSLLHFTILPVDWYPTQLFTRVLIHSLSPPDCNHGTGTPRSSGPFHTLLKALGWNKTSRHARDVLAGDLENAGTFISRQKRNSEEGSVGLALTDDSDDSSDEGEKARDKRLEEQLAARAVVEALTENFKVGLTLFSKDVPHFLTVFVFSFRFRSKSNNSQRFSFPLVRSNLIYSPQHSA